jgi:hypothetical protein
MINGACDIYRRGKGFCWCPSEAWNVNNEKLCQLCRVKNAEKMEKIELVLLKKSAVFGIDREKETPYKIAASA